MGLRAGWGWMALALVLVMIPCSASAQHDDEARGLYSAGAAAFQDGRYDEALGYFQQAYELSHRPQLLYNIGQAADRARHDEVALHAFVEYLEATPDVANRAEIEGRIRVLGQAVAAHRAAPVTTVADPPPAPPPDATVDSPPPPPVAEVHDSPPPPARAPAERVTIDITGVALAVSGGVLIIAGAIMLGVGVPDLGPPRAGFIYAAEVDRQTRGTSLTGVGAAALGVGVVIGVIGAVMIATFRVDDSGPADGASARLRLTPDGFALSF